MALNTDWKEFLNLLGSSSVEFIVVGAWARAHYGEPRLTGDIDFWVRNSPENAARVIQVLKEFGFASLGLKSEDFQLEDQIIQLGYPPRRIDILTSLSGLDFESAWLKKEAGDFDGIPVFYLSKEDFITNKRATGRPKDLADIEAVENQD